MNANTRRVNAEWAAFFAQSGLPSVLTEQYLRYVKAMTKNGFVPIFGFNHLSMLLGRTKSYLASAVNATESHYRMFSIPKRSGGRREIQAPLPALLDCQRWILTNIIEVCRPHPSVHGFRTGRSVVTNAMQHREGAEIVRVDLEDFFPSIKLPRVIALFMSFGYPRSVAVYLAKLCCVHGRLSQGSATSPGIANLILQRTDARLAGLARKNQVRYTRYADDLTFSGARIRNSFLSAVSTIVEEAGFRVNHRKTVRYRKPSRAIVTGVSVSTGELRLPRGYRRALKQEVYYVLKHGLISHASKTRRRTEEVVPRLLGQLGWWLQVEPLCEEAMRLRDELLRFVRSL